MLFNRHVWSDWRLLLALPVAIGLRFIMDSAMIDHIEGTTGDALTVPESTPVEERLFDDHAYRPSRGVPSASSASSWSEFIFSPFTLAAAGGGIVFALGALVALRMWNETDEDMTSYDDDIR